ncbi:uncharacterized protein N7506_005474 [Penicillium brevicompactum]|uniref:uncharacterized protein n=1 Tax=Penicillium brevicompactum TaxID=5074 RepID=UPI00253FC884|nr:uncharacterized protein N7506_005474 [Penicillium brevicompactum]KAJ5337452.1 hypothetical protein N7506_005474 [Penicillium brevicompactum]
MICSILSHQNQSNENRRVSRYSIERSSKDDVSTACLDILVESPPLVCYGPPSSSTGALFSGRLRISVTELAGEVTLNQFNARFISKTTNKKPVSNNCANCATRTEELIHWNFLTGSLFKSGSHEFPLSFQFPGYLPASCNSSLGRIEYSLQAHAHSTTGKDFNLVLPLHVCRALFPGNDESSIRIFPPMKLTANTVRPSVVHPIGHFPVQISLSDMVSKSETQRCWRPLKMMWCIEEHQKIVSTACHKHAHKNDGEGKGVLHQKTRVIGRNEEKNGLKTDFNAAGAGVSIHFEASINPTTNPACDVEAHDGLEVKHDLVIELIVAEGIRPNRKIPLITPAGAAHVFRMRFHLPVTEHSGLGISWDKEVPPVYGDVPASAPNYAKLYNTNITMGNWHVSPSPLPY